MTSCTISFLSVSNADCRSELQANSAFLKRSCRKGCIRAVLAKENETCSMSPYHDRIPVISDGRGKFVIAASVSAVGWTPSFFIQKPTYSSSCLPHVNFLGSWMMPCDPVYDRKYAVSWNSCRSVCPHPATSSTHFLIRCMWRMMQSYQKV